MISVWISIQIPEGMDGSMKQETSARCHASRNVKRSILSLDCRLEQDMSQFDWCQNTLLRMLGWTPFQSLWNILVSPTYSAEILRDCSVLLGPWGCTSSILKSWLMKTHNTDRNCLCTSLLKPRCSPLISVAGWPKLFASPTRTLQNQTFLQ